MCHPQLLILIVCCLGLQLAGCVSAEDTVPPSFPYSEAELAQYLKSRRPAIEALLGAVAQGTMEIDIGAPEGKCVPLPGALERFDVQRIGLDFCNDPGPPSDDCLGGFLSMRAWSSQEIEIATRDIKALDDLLAATAWLAATGMNTEAVARYAGALRCPFPLNKPLISLGVPISEKEFSSLTRSQLAQLRRATMTFLLAHEIGHLAFGHRNVAECLIDYEIQADHYSFAVMAALGESPVALATYFPMLATGREYGSANTHPLDGRRLDAATQTLATQALELSDERWRRAYYDAAEQMEALADLLDTDALMQACEDVESAWRRP